MTLEEFKKKIEEDDEYAPGWDAIEAAMAELYPGQEPAHFGTDMPSRAIFGGNNYLDGFSFYRSPKGYLHLVSFGMTVLCLTTQRSYISSIVPSARSATAARWP